MCKCVCVTECDHTMDRHLRIELYFVFRMNVFLFHSFNDRPTDRAENKNEKWWTRSPSSTMIFMTVGTKYCLIVWCLFYFDDLRRPEYRKTWMANDRNCVDVIPVEHWTNETMDEMNLIGWTNRDWLKSRFFCFDFFLPSFDVVERRHQASNDYNHCNNSLTACRYRWCFRRGFLLSFATHSIRSW